MSVASKWDKAAGKELWLAGKSDKEIGEAFGVSASAVCQIRKKYWENEAVPAAPAAVVEPPLEPDADSAPPTESVVPVPEKDPDEDTAKIMIRALELMTENHKGMNAVATAQIVTRLWNWETLSDLLEAKEFLDYLIEKATR